MWLCFHTMKLVGVLLIPWIGNFVKDEHFITFPWQLAWTLEINTHNLMPFHVCWTISHAWQKNSSYHNPCHVKCQELICEHTYAAYYIWTFILVKVLNQDHKTECLDGWVWLRLFWTQAFTLWNITLASPQVHFDTSLFTLIQK